MRVNQYIALSSELSRRSADKAIQAGDVKVNGQTARVGYEVRDYDLVTLYGKALKPSNHSTIIMLHKPAGYVVSRSGQGSKTIYDLIPGLLHYLKPVGRLDKYTSGLLLLTNNGILANELTHPKYQKVKVYDVELNKPLLASAVKLINNGITLDDGLSKFNLDQTASSRKAWRITMREGRNRQIRRTFQALGYKVVRLHRTQFGGYLLNNLKVGAWVVHDKN